ncbi:MAG: GNAT family N-acetyltransferase [Gemmatimonadales bacterium]
MRLTFTEAGASDAAAIAALRNAAADQLTARFGKGHWSGHVTERGVESSMGGTKVIVGRAGKRLVATACLGTRKPWVIDVTYFTPCDCPLYLTDMAVAPECQGKGIGRRCLAEVIRQARRWPGDAIRLDAYEGPAGAGAFYASCGFVERGHVVYRGTPHGYYELLLPRRPE